MVLTCVLCSAAYRADMVGHTGDLEATARACQLVDKCLKELLEVVEEQGGRWLVTADHGNADDMVQRGKKDQKPIQVDGKNAPLTSHTLVRPRAGSHCHRISICPASNGSQKTHAFSVCVGLAVDDGSATTAGESA